MIAIIPEPLIGIPGTLIGIVRNPQLSQRMLKDILVTGKNFGRVAHTNFNDSVGLSLQNPLFLPLLIVPRIVPKRSPAASDPRFLLPSQGLVNAKWGDRIAADICLPGTQVFSLHPHPVVCCRACTAGVVWMCLG